MTEKKYTAFFEKFAGKEQTVVTVAGVHEFTSVKEAYSACQKFKQSCGKHFFAGCSIDNEDGAYIYDNGVYDERHFIEGYPVSFEAFAAAYNIHN